MPSVKDRFESKIAYESMSGCWLWTASLDRQSYGYFFSNKTEKAHRVSYKLYKGPIPEGLSVCHKCDVPSCVNPDHLWLGTHKDNERDKIAKGRAVYARGESHTRAKLTEDAVIDIRKKEMSQREYARKYGVSRTSIGWVQRRQSWNHV